MYTIRIVVRCSDENSEILFSALEDAECAIEERIALLLQELFGTVIVETVEVLYCPLDSMRGNTHPPAA